MKKLNEILEWKNLSEHYEQMQHTHLNTLFAQDKNRFSHFSLEFEGMLLDFSKNHLTEETLTLLIQLAEKCELSQKIQSLFLGEPVNQSEKRPALHAALRLPSSSSLELRGKNIVPEIMQVKARMAEICKSIREHTWLSAKQQVFTDVINIGIGGSDIGPALVTEALAKYQNTPLNFHFLSHCDSYEMENLLNNLDPARSLFIVTSKSFITKETLINYKIAKEWVNESLGVSHAHSQFIAITANPEAAKEAGFLNEHILPLWDFVGGRYSLWSAVGLPIALAIGMDHFEELLRGAHAMDEHFLKQPLRFNLPVILGLLTLWYTNFFNAQTHAILPYEQRLKRLVPYLQQLEMESNGKSVTQNGSKVDFMTSPIIWGDVGTNSQHTFHQLLHQGTHLIPVDFIVAVESEQRNKIQRQLLLANCFAQSKALMKGKTWQQAYDELLIKGLNVHEAEFLAKHQVVSGNHPSTTLLLSELNPFTLGALLSMYEHKVEVTGMIWDINSFDQWGVELGKKLSDGIAFDLQDSSRDLKYDASTNGLINYVRRWEVF